MLRRYEEVHASGIIRPDTSVSGRRSKDKVDEVNSTNQDVQQCFQSNSTGQSISNLVNLSIRALSPQAQHHSSMCRFRDLND